MAGVCGQGVHGRWGACMTGGMHYSGGMCVGEGGACVAGEMATAAGGTHPTGTHSCFFLKLYN